MEFSITLTTVILAICSIGRCEYTFVCGPLDQEGSGAESTESRTMEKYSEKVLCNPAEGVDIQGQKGQKGDAGLDGQKGAKGARGPYGNFGPQGPRGRTGVKGEAGPPGPMGEVGPIGPHGELGPKGDTGEPGDTASKLDKVEFENYKKSMEERLMILQKNVENLKSCCASAPTATIPTTTVKLDEVASSECLLVYNDKCFKIIGKKEEERSFEQFENDCLKQSGVPANIYDSSHYNLTVEATRADRLPQSTHMMLGMRYDVFKRQLLFSNGTKADFNVRWRPSNPTGHPTHTHIQLYVTPNPYQIAQGLYNRSPNHTRAFGLCEFAMKDKQEVADEEKPTGFV